MRFDAASFFVKDISSLPTHLAICYCSAASVCFQPLLEHKDKEGRNNCAHQLDNKTDFMFMLQAYSSSLVRRG